MTHPETTDLADQLARAQAPTTPERIAPEESDYAALSARFAPLFQRIAVGSRDRDLHRDLPFEEVLELNAAGFSTLRVPAEHGGPGASVETFVRLLVDLAEADSNIAHLYRSHAGFVESLRFLPVEVQQRWYPKVLAGATVGNASTEKGGNALGSLNTVVTPGDDGTHRLHGTKFYATASMFSTHTRVSVARTAPDGTPQEGRGFAVVACGAEGVTLEDDWDGFGQRLTGTGTAVFDGVLVPDEDLLDRVPGSPEALHEAAFFQLVLLAVLAGIARAVRRDAAAGVAARARTFNTGSGLPFREDPIIQEAVGRIAAKAFTAEAAVLAAARTVDVALAAAEVAGAERQGFPGEAPLEFIESELAVEHAQITVPELAIAAAQELFLTGGASNTAVSKGLDRHWRNAQTVATHNPSAFRARAVGDWWINGTPPEGLNAIGDAVKQGDAKGDAS